MNLSGAYRGAQNGLSANEQASARQDLLYEVVRTIASKAPGFRYLMFCVDSDSRRFGACVPANRPWGEDADYEAICDMGEFVIVDARGDEIHVSYADLGYKPSAETREYLAECAAEYFHARIWKDERKLSEGTAWERRGVAGCVVYTDESYPAFRALWDKKHGLNLREC